MNPFKPHFFQHDEVLVMTGGDFGGDNIDN
jgi:hypothetical protein